MKIPTNPAFTYDIPTSEQIQKLREAYKKKYGVSAPINFLDLVLSVRREEQHIKFLKRQQEYKDKIRRLEKEFFGGKQK